MAQFEETDHACSSMNFQLVASAVSKTFVRLHECESIQTNNVTIMRTIDEIRDQRIKLYSTSRESIESMDTLKSYAQEVLSYIDLLRNPECTPQTELSALRNLKEDATINKIKWETLKDQYEESNKHFGETHKHLSKYRRELPDKEKRMKAIPKELRDKQTEHTYKKILGCICVFITIVFAIEHHATFLSTSIAEYHEHLLATFFVAAVALLSSAARDTAAEDRLKNEQDELDDILSNRENVEKLRRALDPITQATIEFKIFWQAEESRIEHLIHSLNTNTCSNEAEVDHSSIDKEHQESKSINQEYQESNSTNREAKIIPIINKWNNVQRECDNYRKVVLKLLEAEHGDAAGN